MAHARFLFRGWLRTVWWGLPRWLLSGLLPVAPLAAQAPAPGGATTAAIIELPHSLAELDAANGLGPYVLGTQLADLPGALTGLKVAKGQRVSCLAPQQTVMLDDLRLPGLLLLSYTGRLYGIYLSPSMPVDTEHLVRLLYTRYGPGQALGGGRVVWQGRVVSVVYEPLMGWRRAGSHRGDPRIPSIRGLVGILSNAQLAQAKADKRTLHELARP